MGAFNINITGVGGHGCERKAKPGEKLYGRCGKFTCPDCAAYDFTQRLRQAGMLSESGGAYSVDLLPSDPLVVAYLRHKADHAASAAMPEPRVESGPYQGPVFEVDGKFWKMIPHSALFTHWPTSKDQVVDDMLRNERQSGQF